MAPASGCPGAAAGGTATASGFQVTFEAPCEGLRDASALSFVSSGVGSDGELYDSIMLDDGTQCRFARVVPTVFD